MDKKKIVTVIGIIAALVVSFMIFWKATEEYRYIKTEMDWVLEEMSDFRKEDEQFSHTFSDSTLEDPEFLNFLSEQIEEMFENAEYELLYQFLNGLECDYQEIPEIRDSVTAQFENESNLEEALRIKEELELLEYYNSNLELNRDSDPIASYIKANGIEDITSTPGTGYYADEENASSTHTVGLSNSPLYDSVSTTYQGDFKTYLEHGVELDASYEETSYTHHKYYFRDYPISFSPHDGKCVYSGDYLFCFSYDGTLKAFEKMDLDLR